MEQEQQNGAQSAGLIYGLNDRPPLKDAIFAALQHLLAIFVAIITPPLIIAGALKLDLETTGFGFPWHFLRLEYLLLFNVGELVQLVVDCCVYKEPVSLSSVRLFLPG